MTNDASRRPPDSSVDARVRIKPAFQEEVETLFSRAGLSPIYKEIRDDGNVSYWFGKGNQIALAAALEQIPLEYWAHYAIVGGRPPI